MKKIVLLFALFGFAFQVTSCKSKKAQDDTQVVENADVEKVEAEDAALLSKADTATNVGPVDDSLQAALGETPTTPSATDPALAATDAVVTEAPAANPPEVAETPALDESSLNNVPAPETTMAAVNTATAPPPPVTTPVVEAPPVVASSKVEAPTQMNTPPAIAEAPVVESTPQVTASGSVSGSVSESVNPESTKIVTASTKSASAAGSLKKITETTPYQHGEGWVNTVYIARPKEKLKDISQKIYGADKTKELKKINTFLAARSPKGGDKIYYISPNRPTDSAKTLSFYEDTGMIAETYVAKKGDNLKKISKNLLGYEEAYKEIWSTNPVASKTALDEGENLRYWKSSTAVAPTMAAASLNEGAKVIESTSQLPSQPVMPKNNMKASTPPPAAETELPPPPPMPESAPQVATKNATPPPTTAQAELPPPPPPPTDMAPPAASADAAALPPPPPPSEELAAAPAAAPKKKVVTPNMEEESSSSGMNSDTMMILGGVVVLCSLFAFALIRRNKNKKDIEMASMSETNVGT